MLTNGVGGYSSDHVIWQGKTFRFQIDPITRVQLDPITRDQLDPITRIQISISLSGHVVR